MIFGVFLFFTDGKGLKEAIGVALMRINLLLLLLLGTSTKGLTRSL
jgi:hypothetical protein